MPRVYDDDVRRNLSTPFSVAEQLLRECAFCAGSEVGGRAGVGPSPGTGVTSLPSLSPSIPPPPMLCQSHARQRRQLAKRAILNREVRDGQKSHIGQTMPAIRKLRKRHDQLDKILCNVRDICGVKVSQGNKTLIDHVFWPVVA